MTSTVVFVLLLLLLPIGAVVALILDAVRKRRLHGNLPTTASFQSAFTLLSPSQQTVWRNLLEAVPPDIHICPSVRLAEIAAPSNPVDFANRDRAMRTRLDFVLVNVRHSRVLAVISMQEPTSPGIRSEDEQRFLQEALSQAGIPLIYLKASPGYLASDIMAILSDALGHKIYRAKELSTNR